MSSIKPCPKSFSFTNPQTKKQEGGTVHQQELVECSSAEHRDYYKVAQLLQWENNGFSIRFGYYLKPKGAKETDWIWGSQTTFIIDLESVKPLMDALTKLMETYEKLQK
jgi:hypothetical protein